MIGSVERARQSQPDTTSKGKMRVSLPKAGIMEKDLQRTFQIVRRLEIGGQALIASRDDFGDAQRLAASLSDVLRGEFTVQRVQPQSPIEAEEKIPQETDSQRS